MGTAFNGRLFDEERLRRNEPTTFISSTSIIFFFIFFSFFFVVAIFSLPRLCIIWTAYYLLLCLAGSRPIFTWTSPLGQ